MYGSLDVASGSLDIRVLHGRDMLLLLDGVLGCEESVEMLRVVEF